MKPDWDKLAVFYNKPESRAQIADVDCTLDDAKALCEKYDVSGFPTIKYWSKDTSDKGDSYEGERDYNNLKKFVDSLSKPPCEVKSLAHCDEKEKQFIEVSKNWDDAKLTQEKKSYEAEIDAAKLKHKELAELFEKQKEDALATMKLQEEAKKEMEKVTKDIKFKIHLLVQKVNPEIYHEGVRKVEL